jgi:hypothetical protein
MKEDESLERFSAEWMIDQIERCKPMKWKALIDFKRYKGTPIIIKEGDEILALTPDEFQERVDRYLAEQGRDPSYYY